ncbi:hypothetical protein P43SY_005239 [Pythium insidiosum]|uniref:RRM domain-containing protein n=1 Tax=Pythium insidiosum TaxID=114742 RepID=A0AAD5Q8K9_PYTIN|nr:hypothetical protein P43SY_005239 [Pythium insidiosum]
MEVNRWSDDGRDDDDAAGDTAVPVTRAAQSYASPRVREVFGAFGEIMDVKIYHDYVDTALDGYMYLTFRWAEDARAAVDAVSANRLAVDENDETNYEFIDALDRMRASIALRRGDPMARVDDRGDEIADLLLGRRHVRQTAPFSQHSLMDEPDEDELMLQSLSQRTLVTRRSSQGTPASGRKKKSQKRKRVSMTFDVEEE